jgi:hypothetical protein
MKKYLVGFIIIVQSVLLQAQEVTLEVNSPIFVNMGELFKVSYRTNQSKGSIKLYPNDYFKIMSEVQISKVTQVLIKNGNKDTLKLKEYSYVLEPTKQGTYPIPKFSLSIENQTYYSDFKEISVIEEKSKKESNQDSKNESFIDVSLQKNDVYIQESFISTIRLYTKRELIGVLNLTLPTYNDFLVFDMKPDLNSTIDTIDGELYYTKILQQVMLYPTKSGEFDLDSIKLECKVNTGIKKDDTSLLFGLTNSTKIKLTNKYPTIRVKKLPGTPPDNFSGITSDQILLKSNLSNKTGKKGASFFYEITLTGNGNLQIFQIPNIDLPKQLKIVNRQIFKEQLPSIGVDNTITYQYEVIPIKKGKFKIPPFSMSYFDLNTKQFETLTTTKKSIKVLDYDNIQNN